MEVQKIINAKYIYFKKEKKVYFPISDEIDEKLMEGKVEINWKLLLFPFNTPRLKEHCRSKFLSSEVKSFYEGMKYEYGLENTEIDLKKAYKIYKKNADAPNSLDYYSMCKMYLIHFMEYKKFSIERDRNLEKLYLFKAFMMLPFCILNDFHYIANKVDLVYDIALHLDTEDPYLINTFEFLDYVNHNKEYKFVSDQEICLIKTLFIYKYDCGEKSDDNIISLNENYLYSNKETSYKVACMLMNTKRDLAKQLFKFCEKKKYYRAYCDYGNLLYEDIGNEKKAMEIFKEGVLNGNNQCISPYYHGLVIENHKNILKNPKQMKNTIFIIMDLLIKDSIMVNNYESIFEFYFWLKLCIKHFDMKEEVINRYKEQVIELFEFLKEIIVNEEFLSLKINDLYELFFACGFVYSLGFDSFIEINYDKSIELLKKYLKMTERKYQVPFIYSIIYKIRRKLFKQGKITKEKLLKTEKKIYNFYYKGFTEGLLNKNSISGSYFFSRLLSNGIGTKQDEITAYFFNKRASILEKLTYLGKGSIVAYYRHYKSLRIITKDKTKKILNKLKEITFYNGNGNDGLLCEICFDNKKNIILIPCKHLLCNKCLIEIQNEEKKCPFCRINTIFTEEVNFDSF